MEITQQYLEELKQDSINTAKAMELFDSNVLNHLRNETVVEVDYSERPKGNWYGQTICGANLITVFDKNLSTLKISKLDNSELATMLKEDNFIPEVIPQVIQVLRKVPKELVFQLFNQSGMDHEILGHLSNYLAKKDWGEPAARQTQYDVAVFRSTQDPSWDLMVNLLPTANRKIAESQDDIFNIPDIRDLVLF
jgi:hypothetical protein